MKTPRLYHSKKIHHHSFDDVFEKHYGKPPGKEAIGEVIRQHEAAKRLVETTREQMQIHFNYWLQRNVAKQFWNKRAKMRKDEK